MSEKQIVIINGKVLGTFKGYDTRESQYDDIKSDMESKMSENKLIELPKEPELSPVECYIYTIEQWKIHFNGNKKAFTNWEWEERKLVFKYLKDWLINFRKFHPKTN